MTAPPRLLRLACAIAPGTLDLGRREETFPVFRWRDGASGLALWAAGSLAGAGDAGWLPERDSVRSRWCEHPDGTDDALLAMLPCALHARPFHATPSRGAPTLWHAWPDAPTTWLPERLAVRLPDGREFALVQRFGGTFDAELQHRLRDFVDALVHPGDPPRLGTPVSAELADADDPSRRAFMDRVVAAKGAIAEGTLRKLVLARAARVVADRELDPVAQFVAIAERAPRAVAFAWELGEAGAWLGGTPEVLARVEGGRVRTSAIAGTGLAAEDPQGVRLADDPKIREEHALVVESMRAALATSTRGLEVDAAPRALVAGHLVHLETRFEATLDAVDLLGVCASLHPTPALGGQPRDAALAWLSEHEGLDRGFFGAPIGWLSPGGDGVLAVGIRSALVRGATALLFAGAGIVRGSEPEAEWAETQAKLALASETLRCARPRTRSRDAAPHPNATAPHAVDAGGREEALR